MSSKKLLFTLLLIPMLVLSACSGSIPSLSTASLPVQAAAQVTEAAPVADSEINLAALQDTFEEIYAKVNPSVVNIQVSGSATTRFDPSGIETGLGSGFVWDTEGHIVTNDHVVSGADEINVTFSDGSVAEARLVGVDPYSDLAVIKVDVPASQLVPVELADSSQVRVGQIAIAIGNPFGLQGTMTQGIVSGLSRSLTVGLDSSAGTQGGRYSIPDIIQTDASINPGNSGGVLVDSEGKVIGVTSAIATTTQVNSGVGFVIPSAIVQKVVPALIQSGSIEHSWMGISGISLTQDIAAAANLPAGQAGILVLTVTAGGPAEAAGLRGGSREATLDSLTLRLGGDVITAVDGQPVKSFEELVSYLFNQTEAGQSIRLTVLRGGDQETIQVTLGARPSQP